MKICPNCNTKNADDSSFCAECGTPLADVAPVTEGAAETPATEAPAAETPAADKVSEASEAPAASAPAQDQSPSAPATDTASFETAPNPQAAFVQTPAGGIEGAAFDPETGAPIVPAPGLKKLPIPVLVAAAVVVVLLLILLFGKSYKSPINTLVNNVNKHSKNVASYASAVLPDFALSYLADVMNIAKKKDGWSDVQDKIDDTFDEAFDSLEDQYGSRVKVSCKITSAKKMSKSKIADIEENYENIYDTLDELELDDDDTWDSIADSLEDEDMDLSSGDIKKLQKSTKKFLDKLKKFKVSAAYKIKADITIKGSDDDDEMEDVEFNVVKVNGKWYVDALGYVGGSVNSLMRYLR
ncbi:MAG: zinc ribbon domain-containing protein [Lachnospiraceae bacterium]|nr:zinc ribbon domain-containing protein [Lachnospiraceae bacterium]